MFSFTLVEQNRAGDNFPLPWGWQVASLIVIALAGLFFGLAAILPHHLSYRPGRAIVLGVIPLLLIVHATLMRDPRTAMFLVEHLRFIFGGPMLFIVEPGPTYALAILLGVAVSSGFATWSKSDQPVSAEERTTDRRSWRTS